MTESQEPLPRLRSDLHWTLHRFAEGASYTVVNPATGLNYQVGKAEYAFASMLDGATSIADAAAATRALAHRSGNHELAIDDEQGEKIAAWLLKMKLAVLGDEEIASRARAKKTQVSPLSIKMPLGDPQRLVQWMSRRARPLTTRSALICCVATILFAFVQMVADSDRWYTALRPLADPNTWWVLGAIALALRVIHEAAHAVVADRFDVAVTEVGILWILMMPLPYVDVSQSWQRSRRRERILIAAAGMLAELFIAAVAVLVFGFVSSEFVQHVAASVAVTASVVTLLFNANVLMRFDGYHMLVDAVGLPNLYADSTGHWRATASRKILGKTVELPALPSGMLGGFARLYGLAALAWRVVVFVGLILAAEHLFGGLGVMLGVAAVAALVVKTMRGLPSLLEGTSPRRAFRGIAITAAILVAIWCLPLLGHRRELGIVRYVDASQVRAGADGFVREILVRRGQAVKQGQPLVSLENAALESEVAMLRLELAAAELKHRRFLSENQMAAVEAQWSSIVQLREQLSQRSTQLEGLTIRAAEGGVVTAPHDLSLWLGRFVREGTEVMRVVRKDEIEVVFLVGQETRDRWSQRIGDTVSLRRPIQWRSQPAVLSSIAPRATDRLPSDSLGAHRGGPLAVRPLQSGADEVRLLQPRFEGRVTPDSNTWLREGERVVIELGTGGRSLGELVGNSTSRWLESRIARHSLLRQFTSF